MWPFVLLNNKYRVLWILGSKFHLNMSADFSQLRVASWESAMVVGGKKQWTVHTFKQSLLRDFHGAVPSCSQGKWWKFLCERKFKFCKSAHLVDHFMKVTWLSNNYKVREIGFQSLFKNLRSIAKHTLAVLPSCHWWQTRLHCCTIIAFMWFASGKLFMWSSSKIMFSFTQ